MRKFTQKGNLFETEEEKRRIRRETRRPDWRFELLAEFENMLTSYGQDHVSCRN